ncbi:MAG: MazG nucleotide pyrophosphohydrolase domain-containing protein [bacterium]
MKKKRSRPNGNFAELKRVFATLQGPNGCPWDKEQTHLSILPQLREEVQELVDAVEKGDDAHMREELGDVLLHVMFHSEIAARDGRFTIEDVIEGLVDKLKRRHPHVFGSAKITSSAQVVKRWNEIKREEKRRKKQAVSGKVSRPAGEMSRTGI